MIGMDIADIPIFAMLRSRMGYLSERQRVIAENVANADTPGYKPHDLKSFSFQARMQGRASTVYGTGRMRNEATKLGLALPTGADAQPQLITARPTDVAVAAARLKAANAAASPE